MISPSSTTNTIVFLSVHDIPFVLCPLILHTKEVKDSARKVAVQFLFFLVGFGNRVYKVRYEMVNFVLYPVD